MVLQKSPTTPSLRDLARELGISHTTVAQALRDNPKVKLATRKRVHAAAQKIGYQSNPLASVVMSGMRLKAGHACRGVVGIIDLDGTEKRAPAAAAYHRELIEGATERADELGFKPEIVSPRQHPIMDLTQALQLRGILGALILPVRDPGTISGVDWSKYATIYADYKDGHPTLHNIFPDHFGAMQLTLRRLHDLGYSRPGLLLDEPEERRLRNRWSAAFYLGECCWGQKPPVPTLVMPALTQRGFADWFHKNNPDVVIAHNAEVMQWMIECGANVPRTHGFCCLNVTKNPDRACSGVDQQPRVIGARGIELVIAQMQRGEYGIPAQPMSATIPPLWNKGSTLRPTSSTPVSMKRGALVAA